jgi:NTP pyrophosphatase (non-canonical NTP hydrolase)
MSIDFSGVDYRFRYKPMAFAGWVLGLENIRPAGDDIDVLLTEEDFGGLAERYPEQLRIQGRDKVICLGRLEFWGSIMGYTYSQLKDAETREVDNYSIMSIKKVFLLKCLAVENNAKNQRDIMLMAKRFLDTPSQPCTPFEAMVVQVREQAAVFGRTWDAIVIMTELSYLCGQLADSVMITQGYRPKREEAFPNVEQDLAHVIFGVIHLANFYQVDLTVAFEAMMLDSHQKVSDQDQPSETNNMPP